MNYQEPPLQSACLRTVFSVDIGLWYWHCRAPQTALNNKPMFPTTSAAWQLGLSCCSYYQIFPLASRKAKTRDNILGQRLRFAPRDAAGVGELFCMCTHEQQRSVPGSGAAELVPPGHCAVAAVAPWWVPTALQFGSSSWHVGVSDSL